jgi:sec-independent protein translocase protein TatB
MGTPPTIALATLGMWDSLLLMVMALVVFGPRRLPEIARKLGRIMYEVRKASNDFKFQMEEELRKAGEVDQSQKEAERLRALAPPAQAGGSVEPVSPVSAATPGAAVVDGQFPVPSPYPEEAFYPEVIATAPAAPAEEAVPEIQPPSTGEQVTAVPVVAAPAENEVSAKTSEPPAEANTDEASTATEQAHHD